MSEAANNGRDVFRRWLWRTLLITCILAFASGAAMPVLLTSSYGSKFFEITFSLLSSIQVIPWMFLMIVASFLNQSFSARWKLFGGAILLLVGLSLLSSLVAALLSSLFWSQQNTWMPFASAMAWQLGSFCFLAVGLHAIRVASAFRIDWSGNRKRPQLQALSVLDLLVITGLIAGLFVLTKLQTWGVSEALGSMVEMSDMMLFLNNAIFAVVNSTMAITSCFAALGSKRYVGWIIGLVICVVAAAASPLIMSALYGAVASSNSFFQSFANAAFSYFMFFLLQTGFLMSGRKHGIRFTRSPMSPATVS